MGTFTVTHDIECSEEKFWQLFLDKEFNEHLYRNALGFPEFNIVEQSETDTEIRRKTAGKPKVNNLPGPVVKLMGSSFGYVEQGIFIKSTKVWTYKLTPSTMADKLRQEGKITAKPNGDNRVKRVAELVIEAKVFGIGGMIESTTEKSLREGWDTSASFMNKWIKEHP